MSSISSGSPLFNPSFGAGGAHHGHHHGGADFKAAIAAAAQDVGVDPTQAADLQKQIDTAIQDARKNADPSADPRKAVQDAIDNVLKNNGVDPAKFHDALKSELQKLRTQHVQAGQSATGAQGKQTDSDGDNDGSSAKVGSAGGVDTVA